MFFRIPLLIVAGILFYVVVLALNFPEVLTTLFIWVLIFFGSIDLIKDTADSIRRKEFALDYIAILAILTALFMQQYLVAAVVVLMLSGGTTLESYAISRAQDSLILLSSRIPNEVSIWADGHIAIQKAIAEVNIGDLIAVRKGEVVPLDGKLQSENALIDESSLTGEPYPKDKYRGDYVRSGTVNTGESLVLEVTRSDKDSTYRRIIDLVEKAQLEKSPMLRLADQYSYLFTVATLVLALLAYLLSGEFERVLAVLVLATPCPLILATPVALMSGVNLAAKEKIIVKKLSALEVLARVSAIIIDKTGTITIGKPVLTKIVTDGSLSEDEALAIAAALERNSLHPFAKAFVELAQERRLSKLVAVEIEEEVGKGIMGVVGGKHYSVGRGSGDVNSVVMISDGKELASFTFIDEPKSGAAESIELFQKRNIKVVMFTGDSKERAAKLVRDLKLGIEVKADCSPEDKLEGVSELKRLGYDTAMLGDGINDAPALALADVGMVFSNGELTAASEAADVVFLASDIDRVAAAFEISQRTIAIAKQSIFVGIGLSLIFMTIAAFGYVAPIIGAFIQEGIDVFVILNALRASKSRN